ncbi:MAG: tetratricopeptide repeat protein [Candidatus Kaelpia aquatica]|nr:tetratricopeptide repeat protein [Candidatus Kaelpia aquatica]
MLRLLSSKFKRQSKALSVLLLIFIASAFFFKSLSYDFLWLDHFQIKSKESILEDKEDFKDAFFSSTLKDGGRRNYYRPIFKIVHSFNYSLFKESPSGFRLVSIWIHIFNLVFLYFILLRLKVSQGLSLMLTLLWGLLPINLSAVVLISARADLLVTFFILASLLSLLLFLEKRFKGFIVLSIIAYILALLSKEIAWPFFLLVVIYSIVKPRLRFYSAYYTLIAFGYIFWRSIILGYIGSSVPLMRSQPAVALLSSFAGLFRYIFKFFVPLNLSLSDAFPKYDSIFNLEVFSGILILSILVFYFFRSIIKRDQRYMFSLGWLLCFYAPISNILPGLHFWAERFFYLPGVGLIFILGHLGALKKFKRLLVAAVLFYAIVGFKYQSYFKNDQILFRRALSVSLKSEEAYNMLGYSYLINNDYGQAIYYYHLAAQDFSGYYTYSSLDETYNNLGVIFMRLGQYSEARKWFKLLIAIDDDSRLALLNLKTLDSLEALNSEDN